MAITKTTTIKEILVLPATDSSADSTTNAGNPSITVYSEIVVDDASDNELPMVKPKSVDIYRYVSDGGDATDVSSEDALVQSIAGAIWS